MTQPSTTTSSSRRPTRPVMGYWCLTPAQRKVLRLLAQGYRDEQIAVMLNITPNTTKIHTHHARLRAGWVGLSRVTVAQRVRDALQAVDGWEVPTDA